MITAQTQDLIPAAAYLRCSTNKQDKSVGEQRAEVEKYAVKNGYALRDSWIYVDDGISGTGVERRIRFQKMMDDAAAGVGFNAVIVWNSDRFSRGDNDEAAHFRYILKQSGVGLVSVTEDFIGRDDMYGTVMVSLTQSQNREYSVKLSQGTLRGQRDAVEEGHNDPGRIPAYGYDRGIFSPDGKLYRLVRWMGNGVRKVFREDGSLDGQYRKKQRYSVRPDKKYAVSLVLNS